MAELWLEMGGLALVIEGVESFAMHCMIVTLTFSAEKHCIMQQDLSLSISSSSRIWRTLIYLYTYTLGTHG